MKNSLADNFPNYIESIAGFIRNNSKLRPFCYFSSSATASTIACLAFLIPQLVMLFVTRSFASLYIVASSVAGSVLAEVINVLCRKKRFYGITSLLQGLLTGLLLPYNIPFAAVFFLTFFSSLVFSYAFGGYSHSWINPVAITVVMAWIFDFKDFPAFLISSEQLMTHNPSLLLVQDGTFPVLSFDTSITNFLNENIFRFFGMSVPEGYVSLFWDNGSVIPAFRFNLITLISSAFLFAFDFISIVIPACYIIVYSFMVFFLSRFVYSGIPGSGDVILAVLSSGTLFCSVFLLSWIGTTPASLTGRICYGICAGIVAFLIVGCGTSPVGSVFTVVLLNIISLFFQQAEDYFARTRLKHLLQKENLVTGGEEK